VLAHFDSLQFDGLLAISEHGYLWICIALGFRVQDENPTATARQNIGQIALSFVFVVFVPFV